MLPHPELGPWQASLPTGRILLSAVLAAGIWKVRCTLCVFPAFRGGGGAHGNSVMMAPARDALASVATTRLRGAAWRWGRDLLLYAYPPSVL
jgi:hypothetical protein